MKPGNLVRLCLALLPGLLLCACEKDENTRILDQIERARNSPDIKLVPTPAQPGLPPQRPEDALGSLQEGQRLVLLCAGDLRDPVHATQLRILQSVVPALGNGLVLKHLDAGGDAAMQLRHMQAAARVSPAVLLVHALENQLSAAVLQDLKSASSIVLSTDALLPAEAWNQRAFVDQKKVGTAAAEVILAALRRKAADEGRSEVSGRVAQITLLEDTPDTKARTEGLLNALKTEPGVILVHDAPGEGTKEGAELRLQEALRLQGQMDAIVVHSDTMALAVSGALSAAGLRESTLLVSIGGLRDRNNGIDMLRRGLVDAVIAHPLPMEKLYPTLRTLAEDPPFKPAPLDEELLPVTLTPKNVDDLAR